MDSFFCLDQRAAVPLPRQSTKPNRIQAPDKFTAQSQPCNVTSVHCWVRDWLDEQLQRSFHRAWKTFPGAELYRTICTFATSASPSKALCSTSRQAAEPTTNIPYNYFTRKSLLFLLEESIIFHNSVSHCQERKAKILHWHKKLKQRRPYSTQH